MDTDFPSRKRTRWKEHDYNSNGIYFITICTENRQQILSRVVGGNAFAASHTNPAMNDVSFDTPHIVLLHHGQIANKYLKQLDYYYDHIEIKRYVIMPNHIHFIISISESETDSTSTTKQHSTISRFVSTFKRFCNREFGENIWQRGFFDHVIRNQEDYLEHLKYIRTNPDRWFYDELYGER